MKLIDSYMRLMRMGLFGFFLAEDITKIDLTQPQGVS